MTDVTAQLIDRNPVDPEDPRAAHVKLWQERVLDDIDHWKPQYKKMRDSQQFAKGTTQTKPEDPGSYVVNITGRHIKQRTASLYARDPKAVFKRRERLHGDVWDGRAETVVQARLVVDQAKEAQSIAQNAPAGTDPSLIPQIDPQLLQLATQITQEAELAQQINVHLDRIGRTLKIVYEYQLTEQAQPFKMRMKQQVRRALTSGVTYVKMGFQRAMEMAPEIHRQHSDITEKLARVRQVSSDLADGELEADDPEIDSLRSMLADLEAKPQLLVREGLTFAFPRSTAIIPDQRLEYLPSFAGCQYVTEEFMLSKEQIQQVYGIHVSDGANRYESTTRTGSSYQPQVFSPHEGEADTTLFRVWQIWSKVDGLVYTIAEGHSDFLEEPAEPDVWTERFWPWFVYAPNVQDDDEDPFPISDVELIRPMQEELNRSREGLREHRFASRPKIVTAAGMLSPQDKTKLQNHPANAVLELQSLAPGAKVQDLLQAFAGAPIDQNLYQTTDIFEDILRSVGQQEANLGGTNGATATENSIAESSRQEAHGSDVDDLDMMLTAMARTGGQILLINLTPETVKQIAGGGAVWPEVDRETAAEEVFLKTEAGSAGRPNQAAELQKFERMVPLYIQTPGLSPFWLAERLLRIMDDEADVADAMAPNSPSILAMNAIVQKAAPFNAGGGGDDGDQTRDLKSAGTGFDNGGGAAPGDATSAPAAQLTAPVAAGAPGPQGLGRPATVAPPVPGF